jgi:hypothetical protein
MPLHWAARKQGGTAKHTQDAEIVSMASGMAEDGIPIQDLLARILRKPVRLLCREDNEAAITAARKGYSPAVRHLPRTQRIAISSVNEMFYDETMNNTESGELKLVYHETTTHKADVFTKDMPPKAFREKLDLLRARPRTLAPEGVKGNPLR